MVRTIVWGLLFWALPAEALADDADARLHHAPLAAAVAGEPLTIVVRIEEPQTLNRAVVVYRAAGAKTFRERPLLRAVADARAIHSPGDAYAAELGPDELAPPALEYAIELVRSDGKRVAAFATRAEPQRIQVPEPGMDRIERTMAERLDNRRSTFYSRGEHVSFGQSIATVEEAGVPVERSVDDSFYRIEGGYTYRLYRVVSEIHAAIGVVRGSAPVPLRELVPGQSEDERFDVGLNYGRTGVRFRFHEWWHFDPNVLVNVTEQGFSVGTGATLHIGDPYGTKLSLGFEAIQEFGSRFFTEVDIQVHEKVRMSPIVEVTNMPSADHYGVRLIGEVGVDIGWGFGAAARGGYQARVATSGGASLGGLVSYAF